MTRRRWLAGAAGLLVVPPWLLAQVAPRREAAAAADPTIATLQLAGLDGRVYRFVDGTPRVRIVNLWARWCAPCRRELPSLQRLAQQLDPARFELLTVALDDDAFALREYARDLRLTLPILPARQADLPALLRARTLPQTLALGPDGSLLARVAGARDWDAPGAAAPLLDSAKGLS